MEDDKKLVEKMIKTGKSASALIPIANEIKDFDKLVVKEKRMMNSRSPDNTQLNPHEEALKKRSSVLNKSMPILNSERNHYDIHQPNNAQPRYSVNAGIIDQNQNNMDEDPLSNLTPKGNKFKGRATNSPNEMKIVLKKMFFFYASLADRLNIRNLKLNKLIQLISDAGIIDNIFTKNSLELLFYKENKNRPNMDFETFLCILVEISKKKFPNLEKKDAFLIIFRENLFPLFANLYHYTDMGEKDSKFKQSLDEGTITILNDISNIFGKLHKLYFPTEYFTFTNPDQQIQKLEHSMIVFLKEFDISPGLIDKTIAFNLFYEVIDTPVHKLTHNTEWENIKIPDNEQGNRFNLSRFLVYIARVGIIYGSIHMPDTNIVEKLIWILDKMQNSLGYVSFEKKMNANNSNITSLYPSKSLLKKVKYFFLITHLLTLFNYENSYLEKNSLYQKL